MNPSLSTTPTNLQACVEWVEKQLELNDLFFGHGTDNAFDEAVWLTLHAARLNVGSFSDEWEGEIDASQLDKIQALLQQRIETRKPLAYLINQAWFAGDEFYVDERVIVPRSHLGEWIPERFEPWVDSTNVKSILDLCCGGGCIAIAMAKAFPDAQIDACDLSNDALQVAQINAQKHDVTQRVKLIESDLFDALKNKRYDLIVSNPPYVDENTMATMPDEYQFEPAMAFSGGDDGLKLIEKILQQARTHLNDNGTLIVETGIAAPAVEQRYPDVPFTWLTSANGDSVIFLLSASELDEYADRFV